MLGSMLSLGERKKLVTHDGSFHADDVFAAALLAMLFEKKGEKYDFIRTRDEEKIRVGDVVFDVGGIYDEEKNRFDHHQTGGAGARPNGIEYSSFGLIWKKFGRELAAGERAWEIVDKDLVAPIDAGDNGQDLFEAKREVYPFLIQNAIFVMKSTWREEVEKNDEYFLRAVDIAKTILEREIMWANDAVEAEALVLEDYQNAKDKRIIVLSEGYPYGNVLNNFPEPLFVIHRRRKDGLWAAEAVRENLKAFKNRKNFPISWGGLRGEEMANVSGVSDAVFCHRGLYIAVAKSKEGALALAERAISL